MFWAPEHAEHEARVGREVSSTLLSPNIRIRSQFSSLQQHQLELDSILSQSWIEFYLFKLKQSSEFQPELTSFGCKVFCGNLSSIGSKSFVIGHWTRTLDLELDCDNSTENKNWPFSTTVLQFHQIRHHPTQREEANEPPLVSFNTLVGLNLKYPVNLIQLLSQCKSFISSNIETTQSTTVYHYPCSSMLMAGSWIVVNCQVDLSHARLNTTAAVNTWVSQALLEKLTTCCLLQITIFFKYLSNEPLPTRAQDNHWLLWLKYQSWSVRWSSHDNSSHPICTGYKG